MKKILLFVILLISATQISFATCPIDGNETVCSLPGFREKVSPVYNPSSNLKEFSGSPEARLHPLDRSDIRDQAQSFAPNQYDYSYNSSCQFGVCLQNRDTPLFQQSK